MFNKTLSVMVGGLCLTLALASATPAQYYDPNPFGPDYAEEWDRMQERHEREYRGLYEDLDELMNPPRQPADGYREPSTMACDTMIYNPAAQQRCYERMQAR